jgi:TRAP-type transport system periplasmic protein
VELEVTDMLTGLNTGLIDCVPCEPYYALAGQFYGPAPYMLDIKWAPLVGGAVITEKAFGALPPETQKAMLADAEQAGIKLTKEQRLQSEKAIEIMKTQHGLHIEYASPELQATWRKLCEDFYPKIRGSIVPADTYDQTRALLDEFRKSGGAAAGTAGATSPGGGK